MNKIIRLPIYLGLILMLSSCSVVLPSTTLSLDSRTESGAFDISKSIDTYVITPALVEQLLPKVNRARNNRDLDVKIKSYQYQIGIGDVLNITVWDHPELTTPAGSYRSAAESGNLVHSNGTIFYPYVGVVKVVGLTVNQVREKLSRLLSEYIADPQIDVNVAVYQSKKAYITGEVKKPGQQFLTNMPLTLLDAVNRAEGLSDNADWHNVTITRNGKEEKLSLEALIQYGDLSQNRLLADGDIVHIPRNDANKVFVMGEVNNSQMVKITHYGMTLTEAIAQSGGIDKLAADATGIFVIRGRRDIGRKDVNSHSALPIVNTQVSTNEQLSDKIADVYQLDLSNAASYVLGTEFYLKPYDVVYVTTAPATRWNRVISQVVPTLSGINLGSDTIFKIRNR